MKRFYKRYYLVKTSYLENDRICLFLENEEGVFDYITENIPDISLKENEIILNSDLCDHAEKLEEKGLYKIIDIIPYNWENYKKAVLNMDIVNKYAIEIEAE